MSRIRVLEVAGSFYEMGYQHGQTFHDAIHQFTENRVRLSMTESWTGRTLSREAVIALADACVQEHIAYAPDIMEEIRGMADATGLSMAELIINNGFTDFIDVVYKVGDEKAKQPDFASDNCTAFLVPNSATSDGKGMYGQTWDMHFAATPHVILVRGKPQNSPSFLTFTIAGCVGMIGMNEHGITVGINNLLGGDGQIGVTWPLVIRKIFQQDNLEDALACITDAKLAGAHNYMLMDQHGNGYNVEAMSTRCDVQTLNSDSIVHTNHCVVPANHTVERQRAPESLASSEARLAQGQALLQKRPISPDDLMALTRDETAICVRATPPYDVESCGAAIMRPASREMWTVWGLPSENEYEHFSV